MIVFSISVAAVFSLINRETKDGKSKYFFKVFGEFLIIGFIVAWIIYILF